MELLEAIVYATLQGFTAVLPLSDSGHWLAARLWLGADPSLAPLLAMAQLGCLLALIIATRRRLAVAFTEGIQGIARPAVLQSQEGGRDAVAIVVAAMVAATTEQLLVPLRSHVNDTPMVAGIGLLLTGAALSSTLLAPAPRAMSPNALGAALAGLAYGLAMLPGTSRIGAAFVVLRWLSLGSWRAAETAMMISVPVVALAAARALLGDSGLVHVAVGQLALAALLAFVSASLAASWWKMLCERSRTALLSLWLVPLSLALIAYSRALPPPMNAQPVQPIPHHATLPTPQ